MREEWHLKKEITVSVILAVATQLIVGCVWLNNLSNTVNMLEREQADVKELPKEVALILQDVRYIREDIEEIKASLERE